MGNPGDRRTRPLADGNEIPLLGLGVWQVREGPECVNAVRWALEAGYRHLDTAQALPDALLVAIRLRRVEVPVPGLERPADRVHAFGPASHLPHAEPAELTAESSGVSHDLRGPSDVTEVLELFDRRYRDMRGEDGPYTSQDPGYR